MVKPDEVEQYILDEVSKLTDEPVTTKSDFIYDLGLDSLSLVELLFAITEKYNLNVTDEDAECIANTESAIEFVMKALSK